VDIEYLDEHCLWDYEQMGLWSGGLDSLG